MNATTAAAFNDATSVRRVQRILNYAWINNRADRPTSPLCAQLPDKRPLCSVPLDHLDQAFKNARYFPETQIDVWLDYRYLDDGSRYFVHSHMHMSAPENVSLRDLNDIHGYRELRMFDPGFKHPIMCRADLARLLIVDHCFKKTRARDIFYSDFDIDHAALDLDDVTFLLGQEGMAFGHDGMRIENSYMAFRRGEGSKFLSRHLLPETRKAASEGKEGWMTLIDRLVGWKHGEEAIAGASLNYAERMIHGYGALQVPHSGYRMSRNPLYFACGINAP